MEKQLQISASEYEVMKVVWKESPVSTTQVIHQLTPTSKWSPKTIQTLLSRLVKKGNCGHRRPEPKGLVYRLYPKE